MGRLLVLLARIRRQSTCEAVKAIAIDERTAVLLEPNGQHRVIGKESAFFLTLKSKPRLEPATPATLPPIEVQRIDASGTSTSYTLRVNQGVIHSTLPRGARHRSGS